MITQAKKFQQNFGSNLQHLVLQFFCIIFFCCIFTQSYAAADLSTVSTNDIIREIEKTLLFTDEEKMQMDSSPVSTAKKMGKKTDFVLKAGDVSEDDLDKEVNMTMTENRNVVNISTRTKEKMAYNAVTSGQYEVAIELYKQVVAAEPKNNYALFSLAAIYQKMGQFKQAKASYYKLLQNNPENKEEIISNILATLAEESPRDALYLLSRLVSSHPQSPYLLMQAALANSNVKNYEQAINLLQQAIILTPDRLDYKYNLAVIYDKSGNYEKALPAYLEIVKLAGNNDNSEIALKAVQDRIATIKEKI